MVPTSQSRNEKKITNQFAPSQQFLTVDIREEIGTILEFPPAVGIRRPRGLELDRASGLSLNGLAYIRVGIHKA